MSVCTLDDMTCFYGADTGFNPLRTGRHVSRKVWADRDANNFVPFKKWNDDLEFDFPHIFLTGFYCRTLEYGFF